MVCWTSTQYPHRLRMTGLLQLAWPTVLLAICCTYLTCVFMCTCICVVDFVSLWAWGCAILVTFCWWYVHATAPRLAHVVAQACPTMSCIRLVILYSFENGPWLAANLSSCHIPNVSPHFWLSLIHVQLAKWYISQSLSETTPTGSVNRTVQKTSLKSIQFQPVCRNKSSSWNVRQWIINYHIPGWMTGSICHSAFNCGAVYSINMQSHFEWQKHKVIVSKGKQVHSKICWGLNPRPSWILILSSYFFLSCSLHICLHSIAEGLSLQCFRQYRFISDQWNHYGKNTRVL